MASNKFFKFIKRLFKKDKPNQAENKVYPTFTLSEDALLFVRKYAIPALKIEGLITEALADEIFQFATECELNMIDPLSKNGGDKTYDYPEKERDVLGDKYVSEVSGRWSKDFLIDLDDLNKRLGFI